MLGLFRELKFCMTAIYFLNYHKKCNMFVYKFASVYGILNPFTVVDEITCSVRRYHALVMYVGLNYYI